MPPFDENGNMMPLWENPPMYIKDRDGTIQEIPRKIPTVQLTVNPEEHDFLPPLDFPPDQTWTLTGKASKGLIRMMKKAEKDAIRRENKLHRIKRKAHRLAERIRRERLKGASMEELWDISLRYTAIMAEIMHMSFGKRRIF